MSKFSDILLGTAVGAAIGILFAPDKGENTRKRLKGEALLAKEKIAEKASEITEQITSTVSSQKENIETQLEDVVSNVSYKAEDVITTLERKLSELKAKNKNLQKESRTNFASANSASFKKNETVNKTV